MMIKYFIAVSTVMMELAITVPGLLSSSASALLDDGEIQSFNCNKSCQLPDCLCMSQYPPGNLKSDNIPQLVFLTFDGAITELNYGNYTAIASNRINPNGCPISMTFFINHEYNDYTLTHKLFYQGHELASNSVTKKNDQTYWAEASAETVAKEAFQMKQMLSKYANVSEDSINGYRSPSLQTSGGDGTYRALHNLGMWDNSMPTKDFVDPPLWPYTLDYGSTQDCAVQPCVGPNDSFPGTWIFPIVDMKDKDGNYWNFVDSLNPRPSNVSEIMSLLRDNFNRHYTSQRAPFGIHLHAAWFQGFSYTLTGYMQFLNYLSTLDDVYIVSLGKGLEWMRNPGTISQAGSLFACPPMDIRPCSNISCTYSQLPDGLEGERFPKLCADKCPTNYPWLDNVDGS